MRINDVISSVMSDQPERLAVANLVNESHRFALSYLWQKARKQRLLGNMFRLSMEDLALDCIADLFQRDETGRYDQLCTYFDGVRWQNMTDEELTISLRRLIFSKVNEGLFRRYREADPSLAKIIRNIKNAVKANAFIALVRRNDEMWLTVSGCDPNQQFLPMAPNEMLEAYLVSCLSNSNCDNLRVLVHALVEFVQAHPFYRNAFPLSNFAQVVRSAFVCIEESTRDVEEEPAFLPEQIQQAIDRVTRDVHSCMHPSYVRKDKVDGRTFQVYFLAVRDILAEQFVSHAPPVASYLDALQNHLPNLTAAAYRTEHRNILEYLVKIARKRLLGHMKNEVLH